MVHADLICVPQLMSGEQALATQIGGYLRVSASGEFQPTDPRRTAGSRGGNGAVICYFAWLAMAACSPLRR
jgi:hypothetical protein